jgi:hypothetical protein
MVNGTVVIVVVVMGWSLFCSEDFAAAKRRLSCAANTEHDLYRLEFSGSMHAYMYVCMHVCVGASNAYIHV